MTETATPPDVGRQRDFRICPRCWSVFEVPAHRRRVLASRGWKLPTFCRPCAAWRRLPRAAREVDLLETALPRLLLTGHPLAHVVVEAMAVADPARQRRACVLVHRWQVREAREA